MPQQHLATPITQHPSHSISQASPRLPIWSLDFTQQSPASAGLTFTRASNAGYYDKNGNWVIALTDTLRVNHRSSSGQCLGFLSEEARTNYLLNSDSPASQTVSLGTGTYTLWLEGDGNCTCAAGTAVGSGWGVATAATPVTITLTTAGTVTFTVSGSVTRFQCENSTMPTSFITTAASAATRSADICSHTAMPFNPNAGTFILSAEVGSGSNPVAVGWDNGAGGGATRALFYLKTASQGVYTAIGGVVVCDIKRTTAIPVGTLCRLGVSFDASGSRVVLNGEKIGETGVSSAGLAVSALRVGCRFLPGANSQHGTHLQRLEYFPTALATETLQQLTSY